MSMAFANELQPTFTSIQGPFMQSGKIDNAPVFGSALHTSFTDSEHKYSVGLQALAVTALILIIFGLIIGYLKPGPFTGLALPAGLTLWVLLGHLARESGAS